MKIKEVSAGVKISKNYDSYSVNLSAELENGESAEKVGDVLIEKAMDLVNKKINKNLKSNSDEKEVGAARFCGNSRDKLSVQYSKYGKFQDVLIDDLEKTDEGFIQKINGKRFIFRQIPDKKRKNDKMPVFRIYGGVEDE